MIKYLRKKLLSLLLIPYSVIFALGSSLDSTANYFPLSVGDLRQFSYISSEGDTIIEYQQKVVDSIIVEGKTYFSYEPLTHYEKTYLRQDTTGNVYLTFDYQEESQETILFRFDVAEGDTYSTEPVFLGGFPFLITVVSRHDTISARAGVFTNCIQFWLRIAHWFDEDLRYWIAPNVGIVALGGDWKIFSTLHYANIQGVVYPPGPLRVESSGTSIPVTFQLLNPYPNPFNPATTIQYDLPRAGHVSLIIYDLLGREVEVAVSKWQEAGTHSVVWDAADIPTGIYFVRMMSGTFRQVRKVMVLK